MASWLAGVVGWSSAALPDVRVCMCVDTPPTAGGSKNHMDKWAAFVPSWGLQGQSMLGLTPCLLMVSAGGFQTFFSIILGVVIKTNLIGVSF